MPTSETPRPIAYAYIRMSTEQQLKGDSLERQLEKCIAFAEKHNLDLASERQLADIGVSAFRGMNQEEGALRNFLDAVRSGSVPRGSYLLVESLDRLSRENVNRALKLFLEITQAGIILVTLLDERIYREDARFEEILYSVIVMSRAYEESKTKSDRIGTAWNRKRDRARSTPMTKLCPSWLKLSDDRSHYEVRPDRAKIVQSIFADAASGMGMYSIARRLNSENVPVFNRSDGWHMSYVQKILNNRATIGEFQPHKKIGKKRVPDGPVLPNYFPAVIDKSLFYQANDGRMERRIIGRGRKGNRYANLFGGLVYCLHCGARVVFENKGDAPSGGKSLVCVRSQRHVQCGSPRWKYDKFEASIFTFIHELDIGLLATSDNEVKTRIKLKAEISSLDGAIAEAEGNLEKIYALYQKTGDSEFVSRKIVQQEVALAKLRATRETKAEAKHFQERREAVFAESQRVIHEVITQIRSISSDEEAYRLRANISHRLKTLISSIEMATLGLKPQIGREITRLRSLQNERDDAKELAQWEDLLTQPIASLPFVRVTFKNGTVRNVWPNPENAYEVSLFHQRSADGKFFGDGQRLLEIPARSEDEIEFYRDQRERGEDGDDPLYLIGRSQSGNIPDKLN